MNACTKQPVHKILPYVKQPEQLVLGEPLYYATSMVLGGYATGVLVAPVKRPGGVVDVYLPRSSDWIELNTGARYPGGALMRHTVGLDTMPYFGRVGYVLPLGPEIDRADAMNRAAPLDEVWLFGAATVPRNGFSQLRCIPMDGAYRIELTDGKVRRF